MALDGSSSAEGSVAQGPGALAIGAAGQAIAVTDLKAILKDTLVEVLRENPALLQPHEDPEHGGAGRL